MYKISEDLFFGSKPVDTVTDMRFFKFSLLEEDPRSQELFISGSKNIWILFDII